MTDPGYATRVGVIIPCFNDGDLLREALDSIDEPELVSVVVVDDCSTDPDTLRMLSGLSRPGLSVVRHERNRGPAAARNTGLMELRSTYVFPLDADDLAVPGALSAMANRLDQSPSAAVCYGDYLEFGEHDLVRAVPHRLDGYRVAYANEYPVSSLLRRTVLEDIGGWRDVGYEDWDLWMTLAERGVGATYLGEGWLTFRKRLHGERRLTADKRRHAALYAGLRRDHPTLFAEIGKLRGESDLSRRRKLLYPIVYGGRRRFAFERHLKRALDRAGVWTLRR